MSDKTCFDCVHCKDYMVCTAFDGNPNINTTNYNHRTCKSFAEFKDISDSDIPYGMPSRDLIVKIRQQAEHAISRSMIKQRFGEVLGVDPLKFQLREMIKDRIPNLTMCSLLHATVRKRRNKTCL